ncbi:unnamed protein product [Adineta steineri]|uniref:EF-hand domain-containing protein n=1 Tax=Adineta steineri TaxID=433720 RepID=A0A815P999_9BILA|nr:unnamed protein product [Adineta steineri]CAF4097474.1 unnamed protein product [Adineta steineri]
MAKDQLSEKELQVLMASTKLSEQELRENYDEFKQECPSGKLDKNKFTKMYNKMTNDSNSATIADLVFTAYDTNRDGKIDFSEFILALVLADKNDIDSKLALSFGMIDQSGDGQITYDELIEYLRLAVSFQYYFYFVLMFAVSKLKLLGPENANEADPKLMAQGLFNMFGVDQDGKLNKTQFVDG